MSKFHVQHVLWKSDFSYISSIYSKQSLTPVSVCVVRPPTVVPGSMPARWIRLFRVVMWRMIWVHVKSVEKSKKIISIVFSQTHRLTGKCWLAPCVLPHGSTKRTHPDRSDACTYFGKIELFSTDFALSHIGKKSDVFQKPSAGARKNLPPT